MNRIHLFALAILSGLLFGFAWPVNGFTPLIFIAWVPLLFAEKHIAQNKHRYSNIFLFNIAFSGFFVWNLITTYWIYYSTFFGLAMALILNSLFFSLTFTAFHITKNKLGNTIGYLSLVCYWLAFEHLHMDWDLSWPWLTLGNVFSNDIKIIQWYEYTGTMGGSLWVLCLNILLFFLIKNSFFDFPKKKNSTLFLLIGTTALLVLPIGFSYYRFHQYDEQLKPVKITVIQPNIDPYGEKFGRMTAYAQLDKIIQLADSVSDQETDFILAPETALPRGIWEEELDQHWSTKRLREFLEQTPNTRFVLGLSSFRMYPPGEAVSPTARKYHGKKGLYYDAYNSAMQISLHDSIQVYHKSRLVPGVEKMPFPAIFKSFEKFALDMGGTTGSLGSQKERSPFSNTIDQIAVAPVICYESIYSEFIAEYVRNGAQLIFIMTNDGWWQDTPGYKQHSSYAALRAIETRRSIARSANTGISSFFNQKGEIIKATKWWQTDAIQHQLNANSKLTFFVLFGKYFSKTIVGGALVLFLLYLISSVKNKIKK